MNHDRRAAGVVTGGPTKLTNRLPNSFALPEENRESDANRHQGEWGIGETAGHRSIRITDWRPCKKNTLVGFFTAALPSGMVLHNVMLHEKNEARWVSFPAREWVNVAGEKQYTTLIDFADRTTANRFRDDVIDALDKHLEQLP